MEPNSKKRKNKQKKWCHYRHVVTRNILAIIFGVLLRIRYKLKINKVKDKRQYLVLFNHQTPMDQFLVGMSVKGAVYYLATEDIFSHRFFSSLIRYLVAPIPICKSSNDFKAVVNCIRIAREGGTIGMAPEGNRTYCGKTGYIKPTVASLARALKLPIIFIKIEGGYGAEPRWSDKPRRGRVTVTPSAPLEYGEYKDMTDDELYRRICRELQVDDNQSEERYKHKESAHYLERLVYVCPRCGFSSFCSENDEIKCERCGISARVTPTLTLESFDPEFKYSNVGEWYDAQCDFVKGTDLSEYSDAPIYVDTCKLFEIIPYKSRKKISENTKAFLCFDSLNIEYGGKTLNMPYKDIASMAVLGRNKLNVYINSRVFQLKGDRRFNAIKYMNIYFHAIAEKDKEKEKYDEFLGI